MADSTENHWQDLGVRRLHVSLYCHYISVNIHFAVYQLKYWCSYVLSVDNSRREASRKSEKVCWTNYCFDWHKNLGTRKSQTCYRDVSVNTVSIWIMKNLIKLLFISPYRINEITLECKCIFRGLETLLSLVRHKYSNTHLVGAVTKWALRVIPDCCCFA